MHAYRLLSHCGLELDPRFLLPLPSQVRLLSLEQLVYGIIVPLFLESILLKQVFQLWVLSLVGIIIVLLDAYFFVLLKFLQQAPFFTGQLQQLNHLPAL
ncbi:hypothetical protein KKC1_14920 [Calderihabitans maritimus]|uniref:Uncharacterized protein n=1 Tax=Calderihabitans maritimus TaxID=1246530 RepID=A0A1Z5HSK4_9FIRM|nr:hypothetical protein KKC1_14920 [Calderihabitans maritimus]